jgi:hypothetical protein
MTGVEMKNSNALKTIGNQKGLAMIETVPLIVIFVVLTSFGMGFFGIVHTAVLHSIAARTYAFETFRQRTNLYYFRENRSGLTDPINNSKKGWRYHAINPEGGDDSRQIFIATTRPIALGRSVAASDSTMTTHNQQIFDLQPRNERVNVNPAWVMVGYGLCLNANCGN